MNSRNTYRSGSRHDNRGFPPTRRSIATGRTRNNDNRSSNRVSVPKSELLERAMKSWGVQWGKNKDHNEFWDSMLQYIRKVERGEHDEQPPNCPQNLAEEFDEQEDAILEVMVQEFRHMIRENWGLVEVIDRLKDYSEGGLSLYGPPFCFNINSRSYVPRKEFVRFKSLDLLDPFRRFHYARRPALTVLREQLQDISSTESYACRGLVAYNACLSDTPCFHHGHCDGVGTVRWNEYGKDSSDFRYWKKLVCLECGSVCEIKTVKSMAKMKQTFKRGSVYGGNFYDSYYAVQKELPRGAKQYVAIQSRNAHEDDDDNYDTEDYRYRNVNKVWSVHVARVRDVEPTLKEKSFHIEDERRKVYSLILLEPQTERHWFDIPFFHYDSQALADRALESIDE